MQLSKLLTDHKTLSPVNTDVEFFMATRIFYVFHHFFENNDFHIIVLLKYTLFWMYILRERIKMIKRTGLFILKLLCFASWYFLNSCYNPHKYNLFLLHRYKSIAILNSCCYFFLKIKLGSYKNWTKQFLFKA